MGSKIEIDTCALPVVKPKTVSIPTTQKNLENEGYAITFDASKLEKYVQKEHRNTNEHIVQRFRPLDPGFHILETMVAQKITKIRLQNTPISNGISVSVVLMETNCDR